MLQQWDHLNEACLVVVHQKAMLHHVHVGYHGAAIHIGTSNLLHTEHFFHIVLIRKWKNQSAMAGFSVRVDFRLQLPFCEIK